MIDRRALVTRHNPRLTAWDPWSPLTVGNGELAFTADFTGLQTFDEEHRRGQPLCTQAQWGWHTIPTGRPGGKWTLPELAMEAFAAGDRSVGYPTSAQGQEAAFHWLRENPHRLHLGRIGLAFPDGVHPEDLAPVEAVLDLWTGTLTSRFLWQGHPVKVTTCCHPDRDLLSFRVESALLVERRLGAFLAFPYGSPGREAADWDSPGRHESRVAFHGRRAFIDRTLDDDRYTAVVSLGSGVTMGRAGPHRFSIGAVGAVMEWEVEFLRPGTAPGEAGGELVRRASAQAWEGFWTRGAAVEFAGSRDPRAGELERRVVLSQYLLAVQCAGSAPPQETGLSCNSWYGKAHLEMHWWHAAWMPLWGRPELLEKSLGWYLERLPEARDRAGRQGYRGARWPKMVGPAGEESPSSIAPLLIWQQPHLLHMLELVRRSRPGVPTDPRWDDLVRDTADFMVSFLVPGPGGRLSLGPPVIPAQENHNPRTTVDPTFELAYWDWGLRQADAWFRRRGLDPDPRWVVTAGTLAPLATAEGVYLAHRRCADTFSHFNFDHPSMLAALGMLPGPRVDPAVMARTLDRVWTQWRWDDVWGWDFPLVAMTAARLGQPGRAVDALFHPSAKNLYSANGHNRQGNVEALPLYLPGNGGLLAAVALMAAGWDGAPRALPGFPDDGFWTVAYEGLGMLP